MKLRRAFDALIARTRFERDMRDELHQHLDARTNDLIASGLSPADAGRQARVEFGAIERHKEQCRDARGFAAFRPLHGIGGDIRLGARRLAATPQFLLFGVLSLAIGIGVTTSVYSILYALIWKPIGASDPHALVAVAGPTPARTISQTLVSVPDFGDIEKSVTSVQSIAASTGFYEVLLTPDSSEALEGEAVTGDYFRTVGVRPALGRAIDRRDDESGATVIVLHDRVWRARFGGDARIIGRVVRLGGQPFEVIGVAPRSYDGLERLPRRTGAWIPLRATAAFGAASAAALESRTRRTLTVVARLNPGGPIGSVTGELRAIAQRLDAEFPVRSIPVGDRPTTTLPRDWMARRLTDTPDSDARMAALILGLVALVLVVACTNLANLVMARGAARQQEIAVRRALGAQRWRLVRELLVEGGIIAVAGGLLSLLVVRALLNLATFDLPLPGRMLTIEPELNPSALAVASITALLSLIVFSLEPAWQLTRATVLPDLAGGDHAVGAVRSTRQRVFIRWQIAASVTFFLIAAVLARAVVTLARNDSGVDLDRLAIATAYLPRQSWDEARARAAMQAIADAVRQEPSIERAAISSGMPFGMNSSSWATATTPDKPFTNSSHFESTLVLASTPEFFRTLGIPILRGRAFDERDDAAAPRVMVISEGTARTFFGTTDAIGRQLMTKMWGREPIETYTVIGVARDTDAGRFGSRGGETTFVPQAQHYEPLFAIAARSAGDVNAAAKLIQKAARRAAPDVAIGTAGPASIVLAGQYFAARVAAALATALGLLTLVLSMIGLYGVQGHLVARRRREIGVRMAIGATREQIGRMVVKDGVRPVVEGIVLGTVLAIVARLLLRTFINANILVVDPLAFVLVPLPLISAAFVACYLPARRASRVDPNEALRDL